MMFVFLSLLRFLSCIDPSLGVTDVSLVAFSAWGFVDSLVFEVDIRFSRCWSCSPLTWRSQGTCLQFQLLSLCSSVNSVSCLTLTSNIYSLVMSCHCLDVLTFGWLSYFILGPVLIFVSYLQSKQQEKNIYNISERLWNNYVGFRRRVHVVQSLIRMVRNFNQNYGKIFNQTKGLLFLLYCLLRWTDWPSANVLLKKLWRICCLVYLCILNYLQLDNVKIKMVSLK